MTGQQRKLANWFQRAAWATSILGLYACQNLGLNISPPAPLALPSTKLVEKAVDADQVSPQSLVHRWIVSPDEARWLVQQGATLLDARADHLKLRGTLQGAIAVTWQQFSQTKPASHGLLLSDNARLTQRLRQAGVWQNRPVVVVADPVRGWGEDGRIVWMLRSLGHTQAVMVDGGYEAIAAAGIPVGRTIRRAAPTPGDFTIRRVSDWEIQREELRRLLADASRAAAPKDFSESPSVVIIDVREDREFFGATPYGEARSGHIPGAIHLHYRDLLDDRGAVLPRAEILNILRAKGIPANAQILTYCTAGVRAGWFTAVLANAGFRVKNYAGSMLEWSSFPANAYPLTQGDRP
ncbi:MAG: sulfurtransferase [Cyanobacteria bacterium J069]|nr:MAG: sulfurtransferase [Cyanobacteria bacterium J069]